MTAALELNSASMDFGPVRVLHNASLRLARGEIRALVGKNGSGKSSLIKILAGYHRPAAGTRLSLGGREIPLPQSPDVLRRAGLSFVHQDLGLIDGAEVLDNILVGRFGGAALAPINWAAERARVREALALFGLDLRLDRDLRGLGPVERTMIAVTRAFLDTRQNGGVIVLDEPSVFLPREDAARLADALRQVAAQGVGVLYVSHRLEEVLSLTQTVTVLRDGHVVHDGPTADFTQESLVASILGAAEGRAVTRKLPEKSGVRLRASGLSGPQLRDVTLALHSGEVVGVTGLAGSGFEELPYLLAAAVPVSGGGLSLHDAQGRVQTVPPQIGQTVRHGIALLPADRRRQSGDPAASLRENVSLPVLGRLFRRGRVNRAAETAAARRVVAEFGVVPARTELPLGAYSGGNQQKALLGKWMQTAPRVLLLHEPVQGVDIGAKHEIFGRIERAAAEGLPVLIASAEIGDLVRICHRVLVTRNGRIVAECTGDQLDEHFIQDLSFRGAPRATPEAAPRNADPAGAIA